MKPPSRLVKPRELPRDRWRSHPALLGLAILAGLVCLFYAEENWRGERAWRACRSYMASQGLAREWQPPEPPASRPEENFAETPFLKKLGCKGSDDPALWNRARAAAWRNLAEHLGFGGRFTSLEACQRELRAHPGVALPPLPREPARDLIDSLAPFRTVMNELRQASLRPKSAFVIHGARPQDLDIPNFVLARDLAYLFALEACAHLALGSSPEAAQDLRVVHRLSEAITSCHRLVTTALGSALMAPYLQVFWEGWARGQWTEEQWLEFQGTLRQIELLTDFDRSFREGELPTINYLLDHCSTFEFARVLEVSPSPGSFDPVALMANALPKGWISLDHRIVNPFQGYPRGWMRRNQAVYNRQMASLILGSWDVSRQQAFPRVVEAHARALEAASQRSPLFHGVAKLAVPNTRAALASIARHHALAKQAELVCALERYRLKQGTYPERLDTLVPAFIDKLPPDPIGGGPMVYRLGKNGEFALYSIGWDEQDDNGRPASNRRWSPATDAGDWVWPPRPLTPP